MQGAGGHGGAAAAGGASRPDRAGHDDGRQAAARSAVGGRDPGRRRPLRRDRARQERPGHPDRERRLRRVGLGQAARAVPRPRAAAEAVERAPLPGHRRDVREAAHRAPALRRGGPRGVRAGDGECPPRPSAVIAQARRAVPPHAAQLQRLPVQVPDDEPHPPGLDAEARQGQGAAVGAPRRGRKAPRQHRLAPLAAPLPRHLAPRGVPQGGAGGAAPPRLRSPARRRAPRREQDRRRARLGALARRGRGPAALARPLPQGRGAQRLRVRRPRQRLPPRRPPPE